MSQTCIGPTSCGHSSFQWPSPHFLLSDRNLGKLWFPEFFEFWGWFWHIWFLLKVPPLFWVLRGFTLYSSIITKSTAFLSHAKTLAFVQSINFPSKTSKITSSAWDSLSLKASSTPRINRYGSDGLPSSRRSV